MNNSASNHNPSNDSDSSKKSKKSASSSPEDNSNISIDPHSYITYIPYDSQSESDLAETKANANANAKANAKTKAKAKAEDSADSAGAQPEEGKAAPKVRRKRKAYSLDYLAWMDDDPAVKRIRSIFETALTKSVDKRMPYYDLVEWEIPALDEHRRRFWEEVLILARIRTMALQNMEYSELLADWKERFCQGLVRKQASFVGAMVSAMMEFERTKTHLPKECDIKDPYNTPLEFSDYFEDQARKMLDTIEKASVKCGSESMPADFKTMYFWLEAMYQLAKGDCVASMDLILATLHALYEMPQNFFGCSWMCYVYGDVPLIGIAKDYLFRTTLSEVDPMDELMNLQLWAVYMTKNIHTDEARELIGKIRTEMKKSDCLDDILLTEGVYHLFQGNTKDALYCFDQAVQNARVADRRAYKEKIAIYYATHFEVANSSDITRGNTEELTTGLEFLTPRALRGVRRYFLFCQGLYNYEKSRWKEALEFFLQIAKTKLGIDTYTPFLGNVDSYIAICYDNIGDTETGIKYHLEAAKKFSKFPEMRPQQAQEYFSASRIWAEGFDYMPQRDYFYRAYDLIKNNPNSTIYGYIMIAMGKISMHEDEFKEAIGYFQKAQKYYMDHPDARSAHDYVRGTTINMAECYLALDNNPMAEKMFRELLKYDRGTDDIRGVITDLMLLGKQLRKMGLNSTALEFFDEAIELLESQKAKYAYEISDRIIERMLALREKGNLLFTEERVDESVATFRKIVDAFYNDIQDDMYELPEAGRKVLLHLLNETAVVMRVGAGNTALAEDLIKRFGEKLAKDDHEMRTLLNITLSQVYKDAGEMEKAEDATISVIRQLENDPNVTNDLKAMFYNDLGMIMGKMDRPEEAEGAFGQAFDIIASGSGSKSGSGDHGAETEEDLLAKIIPQVTYLRNRGHSLRGQGNLVEAEKVMKEVLEKMEKSGMFSKNDIIQIKLEIIELELLQKHPDSAKVIALEVLKSLPRTDQRRLTLYMLLAITYKGMGDITTANKYLNDYLTFVKRWRNDDVFQKAEIYRELANNHLEMHQYEEALENILKCEEIYDLAEQYPGGNPLEKTYPLSVYGLHARYFQEKDSPEKALEWLEKAMDKAEVIPDLPKVSLAMLYDYVGQCYFAMKEIETAVQYYRKAMENTSEQYPDLSTTIMANLTYALGLLNKHQEAEQMVMDRIVNMEHSGVSKENLAVAYKFWGLLVLGLDRIEDAERKFSIAEDLIDGTDGERRIKADLFFEMGMALNSYGKRKSARRYLKRALKEMDQLQELSFYVRRSGDAMIVIADSYLVDGMGDRALDYYEKAIKVFEDLNVKGMPMLHLLRNYAYALYSVEDYEEALKNSQRLLWALEANETKEDIPVNVLALDYDFYGELQRLNNFKNEAMATYVKALKFLEGTTDHEDIRKRITKHLTDI